MRHAGFVFIFLLLVNFVQASTIKVPTDQPTIQDGINAAFDFDTVLVEPGTYTGTGNQNISFMGKRLAIIGEGGSQITIINLINSDSSCFSTWDVPFDPFVKIAGFTIIGANYAIDGASFGLQLKDMQILDCDTGISAQGDLTLDSCIISNNNVGVWFWGGAPTLFINSEFTDNVFAIRGMSYPENNGQILNCEFTGNTIAYEFGIGFRGSSELEKVEKFDGSNIPPYHNLIDGCHFTNNDICVNGRAVINNTTFFSNGTVFGLASSASLIVSNCEFANTTDTMIRHCSTITVSLEDCNIHDNLSTLIFSDGEFCFESGTVINLKRCVIRNNLGGLSLKARLNMEDCLYYNNSKPVEIVDMIYHTWIRIHRSTFAKNASGAILIAGLSAWNEDDSIKNIIVANNRYGIKIGFPDTIPLTLNCSNIFDNDTNYVGIPDQTGLHENISLDPLFYDTANGNYGLSSHSPCAPDNNNCSELMGAYTVITTPPSVPIAQVPSNGSLPLFNLLPTFDWSNAIDPDPFDTVRYTLEIAINPGFSFVNTIDSVAVSQYTLTDSLEFSKHYWWRVTAFDTDGLTAQSSVKDFWTWTLGDVNHTHSTTVADLTYMVQFLFNGGQAISPMFVGDLNASCNVTISDLVYLVQYLFNGGAAPKIGCGPS